MQLELDELQKTSLIVMLNIELRSDVITFKYATALNDMFKQLVGHDHASMETRNESRRGLS